MRPTARLLTARLPAFAPTGLTGALTHPHPRPTLIALYNHTLSVLSELPAHSVYRQATENLTRQRLEIVSSVRPDGYADHQRLLASKGLKTGDPDIHDLGVTMREFLTGLYHDSQHEIIRAYIEKEWGRWDHIPGPEDAETTPQLKGDKAILPNQTLDQASANAGGSAKDFTPETPPPGQVASASEEVDLEEEKEVDPALEPRLEPQLSMEQVQEIEKAIGEGLIEEVVEQGWAELACAQEMVKSKVWEPLAEAPVEGQWVAFERPLAG